MPRSTREPRWQIAFFLFALYTLFYAALLNGKTPFRGEHWALLYAFEKAPTNWIGWQSVSDFVCFGVKRFQPLAFFPTLLSYLAFGTSFCLHALFSVFLHLASAFFVLHLIDIPRQGSQGPLRQNLFARYPLEAAFFLVAFPSIDVMLWTFFHYIQVALVLALFSAVLWLRYESSLKLRSLAISLAVIATLIYEPFLMLVLFYGFSAFYRLWKKRKVSVLDFLIPFGSVLAILPVYFSRFSDYLHEVAAFSELQRSMVTASIPERLLYLAYKIAFMLVTVAWNLVTPATASKRHIYEMATVGQVQKDVTEGHTFLYLDEPTLRLLFFISLMAFAGALWVLWKARRDAGRFAEPYFLYGFLLVAPFSLIAWGRPVVRSISVSVEFRYAFILLPFLVILSVAILSHVFANRRMLYQGILAVLVALNTFSVFRHASLVRYDYRQMSGYVEALKTKLPSSHDVVVEVTENIAALTLPFQNSDESFVYNAQQCVAKYVVLAREWERPRLSQRRIP